jgi:hypothetical protein
MSIATPPAQSVSRAPIAKPCEKDWYRSEKSGAWR